ncbi:MAG: RluA family pseudouridine synthase [Methylococcus sp.]
MFIHYHQADLMIAEKPAGLLCQPGLGPELADSLLIRIRRDWPSAELVHRLDRDTSGLLMLALAPELHRALSRLFADRQIEKTYIADVAGTPDESEGCISLPIAKRCQRPPLYGVDPDGKPCLTEWRLVEGHAAWSRLELRPRTGRSHQLRVHLAAIGHPILGDPLYGDDLTIASDRLRLHASGLKFEHPFTAEVLTFHSECPF